MDVAAINKLGIAPLQPELDRIAALKSTAELPALLAHLHTIGVNAFFGMGSSQDSADASPIISFYSAGGLGLPERDYYTRTDAKSVEQRQQYVDHVRKMFVLAGEPDAQAAKDADTVMAIETPSGQGFAHHHRAARSAEPESPHRCGDLRQGAHAFFAADYLAADARAHRRQSERHASRNFLRSSTRSSPIRRSTRSRPICAGTCCTPTPAPACRRASTQENWNFYAHILNGAEKQQERWKRCTSRVDREMGEALGQVYVAKYFPPAEKQRALDMTLAIEQAMDKDIDGLDWMSAETKVKAKEKLHAVMNKIGYPDKWRDYSKLTIVRGDALGNQMRAHEFDHARDLAKIGKPVDKGEWHMTPPTVNAYYDPQQNNVNFPAGYFQPPFFSDKEDDAANYGDMGSTIGHELTHGFDDEGRQFDKDGNLKDWWTKDDETEVQRARGVHGEAV